jgi:hypothetical protein
VEDVAGLSASWFNAAISGRPPPPHPVPYPVILRIAERLSMFWNEAKRRTLSMPHGQVFRFMSTPLRRPLGSCRSTIELKGRPWM